ncbi:protein O-linked-mannose beta-1,2-N-acetylglucosaminyltransferase 1-like [Oppia nitens]|uniref:protein O-linked-mannose beta-1,2-N-acetylglucosaminyltransferase 1-like n=1 Tax=Oppia nitens TaxID=1686743 RepID=UPI0023DA8632|nr:protein O-linked-mannose beta-1,2-N-acetylglucosaminyltransferase 1-like [Oppia nitens]
MNYMNKSCMLLSKIISNNVIQNLIQLLFIIILMLTVAINMMFIIETNKQLKNEILNEKTVTIASRQQWDSSGGIGHTISLEVVSSQSRASITSDGISLLEDSDNSSGGTNGRGIHVLVLHESTGSVMAERLFDTYSPHEDEAMSLFLSMVTNGRIVVMCIKDEGTFQMKQSTRDLLKRLGSLRSQQIAWRDMWAIVVVKGEKMLAEGYSRSPEFNSWGAPVVLRVDIMLTSVSRSQCRWTDNEDSDRRRAFCARVEGYGSVCSCSEPAPISFANTVDPLSPISSVPVAVVAANRPQYLYRMLRSLLSAKGCNPSMITVFIDGYFEEPLEVTKLFGLRVIQHTPIGVANGRISQHYKASLTATFSLFPSAQYAIIVEEDLDISTDFFQYFQQTIKLVDEDPSIYCISAWNDQGYEHTSADPGVLYRVETMPGLGWLLTRRLYKEELEPKWPTPEKLWDWDMWMRLPDVRRQRECIIPDVSRTYHFGSSGVNMNSYFQDVYFKKHAFNTMSDVVLKDVDRLKKDNYEQMIYDMIRKAVVVDHSKSPCESSFIPSSTTKGGQVYVVFIKMLSSKDYSSWLSLAKCLQIWDLDPRGYHKSMWRLHYNDNHILVIGVPNSPYSKFKPSRLTPIYFNN